MRRSSRKPTPQEKKADLIWVWGTLIVIVGSIVAAFFVTAIAYAWAAFIGVCLFFIALRIFFAIAEFILGFGRY